MKIAVFDGKKEPLLLGNFFLDHKTGIYVDVGANIPDNSVTRAFHEKGWQGLIIEPIPDNIKLFLDSGRTNIWQGAVTSPENAKNKTGTLHLAGGPEGPHSSLNKELIFPRSINNEAITVQLKTLNELLTEKSITRIDLLSIDTEGTEIDVLKGIDLKKFDVTLVLVEDWARNLSTHSYMTKQDYKLVRRTGYNSWYIKKEAAFPVSIIGRLQLFRKYVLGMPFRKFRFWKHKRKNRQ